MSDQLIIREQPALENALMFAAWSGWSDAGESATNAVRYVADKLGAVKFAQIEPEEFYIFSELRPHVQNSDDGGRELIWPCNEFYYLASEGSNRPDMVFFVGTEPNMKWQTYTTLVADVANAVNVEMLAAVGALLDEVPHTREAVVVSTTVHDDLGPRYEHIRYSPPNYEGPAGMTSATIDQFSRRGIKSVSIWGHAPRYLPNTENPAMTLGIVNELQNVASFSVPVEELESEIEPFNARVDHSLENTPNAAEYIRALEERYDSEMEVAQEPETAMVVDELDEFLKSRFEDEGDDASGRN